MERTGRAGIRAARTARTSPASGTRVTPAGRPTPAELERRKQRVIEVATSLFIEKGFAETSLVQIARRAGVGSNLIYQHFGDKEQLFREIIFARRTNRFEVLPGLEDGESLSAALLRAARYICGISFRDRSLELMRLIIAESQRFPELMRAAADKSLNTVVRNIAAMLEQLAEAGMVRIDDRQQAARLFLDLILGVSPLRAYANWELAFPTDDELALKVDVFIRGYLRADP